MNKLLLILLLGTSMAVLADTHLDNCSSISFEVLGVSKGDWKNHNKMIEALRPLAENGNRTAQHFLASRLLVINPGEALKWAKRSFENGCIDGAILMAMMYDEGMGVIEDQEEAFKWYLIAAEAGDVTSASMVSYMYNQGKGVDKNEEKSLYWLKFSRGEL
jgi:uncharacterized protein